MTAPTAEIPLQVAGGPYALYRYFDVNDRLLYVGISGDLAIRDKSHISKSGWMQLAARSAVQRRMTLEEIKKAEREAIETEHPLFNVQYNDTPEARERIRVYLAEIGRPDLVPPRFGQCALEEPDMTETEAREALKCWREQFRRRDTLVRAAHKAGVTKYAIFQLTGLARTTIDDILSADAGRQP